MKQVKNVFAVGAALVASVVSTASFAALDTGITTALGDAKSNVAEIGGLVIVVLVAAAAFKYMRRAL